MYRPQQQSTDRRKRLKNCGGPEKAAHHTSSVRNMAVVGVDRRRSFALKPTAPYCALIFSGREAHEQLLDKGFWFDCRVDGRDVDSLGRIGATVDTSESHQSAIAGLRP
ncbi:hypothetical protein ACI514_29470 [Pseudomonas sp. M20]|uniref:hypothetical protein n=1 Tax=unclassified Pseudomonas TaxID=196821 RepID=UPI001EEA5D09|nr:hypothetical protein [Pseudomonas sp. R84]